MSTEGPPALVVDLDTSAVRAFVLEQVEGERRLVARVNVPVPHPAVPSAVAAAVATATEQVRQLSTDPEAPATEVHLLTNRPAAPRTLLVAARADQVAEYTLATLNEIGVHQLEPLYMHGRQAAALTDVAEYLRTAPADIVILLCTGRHQDWLPIQAVAELLAHGTPGPSRPIPIVAGDVRAALDAVTQALGPILPPGTVPARNGYQLAGAVNTLQRQRAEATLHWDGIRRLPLNPEGAAATPPAASISTTAIGSRL
ncbi:MAG: hypothetical protein OXU67_14160, partial [Chloroflexota bacterium]|nr:hypothetical protein [Chloroflexota bacterium]